MTFLDENGFNSRKTELASKQDVRMVDASEMGFSIRRDGLSTPGMGYLELTKRCDGQCAHCYANAGSMETNNEMSFKQVERLLEELAGKGMYAIRLTGGEPTLREDLLDVLDVINHTGMKPSLNTHGLYGEGTLRGILEKGVKDIRISLDGEEEVNDAIRGKGGYRMAIATLHRLKEFNQADPTINVVLMRSNLHCIGHMIRLGRRYDCKVSFGLLRPAGRAGAEQMLSREQVLQAASSVERRRQELGLTGDRVRINYDIYCKQGENRSKPFPFDNTGCPIGTMGLGINSNGRVTLCHYLNSDPWIGESVLEKPVMEIWSGSGIINRARALKRKGCESCAHYGVKCNGGCPATAYQVTGDLDGRDPYCIHEEHSGREKCTTKFQD